MAERGPRAAEPRIVIGIDLGTTNSLAAVPTPKGPRIVRDRDGEALIPSVVCFLEDGSRTVGRPARDRILDLPDRTVFSVKRLIGRAGEEVDEEARRLPYSVHRGERGLARVVIDGREHSPEEISAMVLREVAATAAAALAMPVEDAVITIPAYFDDGQRQATKDAAALAGLNCLRILNEPTAASLAYGIDGSRDGVVLVYDLGGGTFDVSVLKIQDGVFRVLATAGDTHLGGDDFDRLLSERILAILKERTGRDQELSPYVLQTVRRSAEGLKIQISEQEEARLHIDLGSGNAADLRITRTEFEDLIGGQVERTVECLRRTVKDAGVAMDEIDELVLVGGSTRIPLVRRRLAEVTGREAHTDVDPDQAVALGAAIQADVLAGRNKELLLLDVIPLSLGLETMGGVVSKMILRNATIPTSHTEEFSTQVDDQTGVDINIYQGERELTKDCRKLGSFKLTGIPPMPAGLPRIAVTFLVDADGVLRVRAVEQRTGNEASIQVVPSFGLTREEVRRMMSESLEHAQEDMDAREAVELRNKAAAMVTGTRKALEMSDLPPDQSWSVRKAVQALDGLLRRDAPIEQIRAAVDEVSRLTNQIADDVISSAVKKALTGEAQGP